MFINFNPIEIEKESFRIIDKKLDELNVSSENRDIIRRVIHATTDFNYVTDLVFHPNAINAGIKAIKEGKNIITDVAMVKAGINKGIVSDFGGEVICLINDQDVMDEAKKQNLTRAIISMRKASQVMTDGIVAIGNAPTALFELCNLIEQSKAAPALIVGIPVGFVGSLESKNRLREMNIPYIINQTIKGGSSVAASIVNALLKIAEGEK